MIEAWLLEMVVGIGKLFLNPLLYWSILLVIIVGNKRIKQERINFGVKVFDVFSEWRNTWLTSIICGLVISIFTLGIGIVLTYETVFLLMIVIILLSLSFRLTMLSASYTIGITFLLILFSPLWLQYQSWLNHDLFAETNFTGLIILLGMFLFVESIAIGRIKRNETYPDLSKSNRGLWIGQHHLKKLHVIPFFVLIPSGLITPFAPYWPHFSVGGETYSLLLIPFLVGFDHIVKGHYPQAAANKMVESISLLGLVTIILAIGSMYLSWLSVVAVIIAILGRELINYQHRVKDKEKVAYFNQGDKGLKILGIIPGTPAARLNILVGETIVRVNGQDVDNVDQFYQALQDSGAYFKLDITDDSGEVRFVQNAFYEGDHYELGLLFTGRPHRIEKKTAH